MANHSLVSTNLQSLLSNGQVVRGSRVLKISWIEPQGIRVAGNVFSPRRSHCIPILLHRPSRIHSSVDQADFQPPWALTFDLRERETIWTDENKARLIKLVAGDNLGISRDELDTRVEELLILVPDLGRKLHTMKVTLLVDLLKNVDRIALQLIALREMFPKADISRMAAQMPEILLSDPKHLANEANKTAALLCRESIDDLVSDHPGFLDAEVVEEVLDHLAVLMPTIDVQHHLQQNPELLLSAAKGKKRLGDNLDPGDTYITD